MIKISLLMSAAVLAATIVSPVQAQDDLIYVAVKPCRIVNTRISAMGVINANTFRNFLVSGTSGELAVQGGKEDCLNPKAGSGIKPLAVAAYIVAVPADSSTRGGILTAYPSNEPPPPAGTGATLNFAEDQIIGNTTIATLCDENQNSCPSDGSLAILARDTDEHVVIDVQGYFYAATSIPGYQIVKAPFAIANSSSVDAIAQCQDGRKVLGGGGNLVDSTWFLDSSYPVSDGSGWHVRYRSTGATFSASGSVWAICALAD